MADTAAATGAAGDAAAKISLDGKIADTITIIVPLSIHPLCFMQYLNLSKLLKRKMGCGTMITTATLSIVPAVCTALGTPIK